MFSLLEWPLSFSPSLSNSDSMGDDSPVLHLVDADSGNPVPPTASEATASPGGIQYSFDIPQEMDIKSIDRIQDQVNSHLDELAERIANIVEIYVAARKKRENQDQVQGAKSQEP